MELPLQHPRAPATALCQGWQAELTRTSSARTRHTLQCKVPMARPDSALPRPAAAVRLLQGRKRRPRCGRCCAVPVQNDGPRHNGRLRHPCQDPGRPAWQRFLQHAVAAHLVYRRPHLAELQAVAELRRLVATMRSPRRNSGRRNQRALPQRLQPARRLRKLGCLSAQCSAANTAAGPRAARVGEAQTLSARVCHPHSRRSRAALGATASQ